MRSPRAGCGPCGRRLLLALFVGAGASASAWAQGLLGDDARRHRRCPRRCGWRRRGGGFTAPGVWPATWPATCTWPTPTTMRCARSRPPASSAPSWERPPASTLRGRGLRHCRQRLHRRHVRSRDPQGHRRRARHRPGRRSRRAWTATTAAASRRASATRGASPATRPATSTSPTRRTTGHSQDHPRRRGQHARRRCRRRPRQRRRCRRSGPFQRPSGICSDAAGTIHVADTDNQAIRRITPAGVVSTLAGASAGLSYPWGVAADAGAVYVADTDNCMIRVIAPSGEISTLAGSAGEPGSADGAGAAARFDGPRGVACDGSGNIYVADTVNSTIRRVTVDATAPVTTATPPLASSATSGWRNTAQTVTLTATDDGFGRGQHQLQHRRRPRAHLQRSLHGERSRQPRRDLLLDRQRRQRRAAADRLRQHRRAARHHGHAAAGEQRHQRLAQRPPRR